MLPRTFLPMLPRTASTPVLTGGVPETMNSRTLSQEIKKHTIDHLLVSSDLTHIVSEDTNDHDVYVTEANPLITSKIIEQAFQNNVLVEVDSDPRAWLKTLGSVAQGLLYVPLVVIGYNLVVAFSKLSSRGPGPGRPGPDVSSTANLVAIEPVRLQDWAGSPEVLRECSEIVLYLKDRKRFAAMGAKIPRGILLEGPPGTGKTLLAKAIACEAKATFISLSGSEFVEMYVGLGASRVRDLFRDARRKKPTIIFIDEIDAVGEAAGDRHQYGQRREGADAESVAGGNGRVQGK